MVIKHINWLDYPLFRASQSLALCSILANLLYKLQKWNTYMSRSPQKVKCFGHLAFKKTLMPQRVAFAPDDIYPNTYSFMKTRRREAKIKYVHTSYGGQNNALTSTLCNYSVIYLKCKTGVFGMNRPCPCLRGVGFQV